MADAPAEQGHGKQGRRAWRVVRVLAGAVLALAAAVTVTSFGYNLATDGPAPRPSGLLFAHGGGFDTRYREWGTTGTPVVLVPGAFETADTFATLGPVLAAAHHRVFAIDLTGTGYSAPSPPYSAAHLAQQLIAFEDTEHLTGANAPVLVGHSAGAAVVGLAALRGTSYTRGVVFLDGDATPLSGPGFLGALLINPFRTTVLRLALSQDWLIRKVYDSQCGPGCPALTAAGAAIWRMPLQQPGFAGDITYTISHGIPAMTPAQFRELHAAPVPKLIVFGRHDPQMSASDAAATARRIGAPAPVFVPGWHLTMIASPHQITAALERLTPSAPPRG
ncbi:MAG TPA: alpha/beta hydrolase [Streptosporangiaceae bacterium]